MPGRTHTHQFLVSGYAHVNDENESIIGDVRRAVHEYSVASRCDACIVALDAHIARSSAVVPQDDAPRSRSRRQGHTSQGGRMARRKSAKRKAKRRVKKAVRRTRVKKAVRRRRVKRVARKAVRRKRKAVRKVARRVRKAKRRVRRVVRKAVRRRRVRRAVAAKMMEGGEGGMM